MRGVPTLALVITLGACGSVKTGDPDASRSPDAPAGQPDARVDAAPPPDAMVDAAPALTLINSVQMFPNGASVIQNFTPNEMQSLGVSAMGLGGGASTSITGNADAPISQSIFIENSAAGVVTFTFTNPITAVGISTYDADYGNDNAVIVKVAALSTTGAELAVNQRALSAANALTEQNNGALFVGFSYSQPFTIVSVSIDQANSTGFDLLRFR